MALMTGQGPFGHAPAGSFNRRLPGDGLLYLEPSPRRIRGLLGGEVVVDSTRVSLLLEHGRLPRYYFPEADVRPGLLVANGRSSRSEPKGETRHFDLRLGDRVVPDGALTHPAPPPEALPALAGLVAFFWKALDGWLEEDEPALGHATYWSVRLPSGLHENIAWTYLEPRHDALAVGGLVAFFDEQVDLEVDGQPQPRPRTPWSAPRWWERTARLEAQL
jgi:uncharacterized protein (DUF427 family)